MEQIEFVKSDLMTSRIGLGTWAMGGWMWGGTDEAQSIATIRSAMARHQRAGHAGDHARQAERERLIILHRNAERDRDGLVLADGIERRADAAAAEPPQGVDAHGDEKKKSRRTDQPQSTG
jgi:hypothetical protein